MTADLSRFLFPKGGLYDRVGKLTRAGHGYLLGIEEMAKRVVPLAQQIEDAGGAFGALATLDQITRAQLASGFGIIALQRTEVAASTALVTSTGTTPRDDTIPQVSEGGEVLVGTFTPLSAASAIEVELNLMVGSLTSNVGLCAALFVDAGADAVAARWLHVPDASTPLNLSFRHRFASPGLSQITFALRLGATSSSSYLNGGNAARVGGGAVRSSMFVTELETI